MAIGETLLYHLFSLAWVLSSQSFHGISRQPYSSYVYKQKYVKLVKAKVVTCLAFYELFSDT